MASRPNLGSPTPSFRPFDRRFVSRLASSSSLRTPRPSSPALLGPHSRQASISSQILFEPTEADTPSAPWEVVRWTKLRKISGQAFSEAGRRNFGSPTCIVVSATIALGTSKGVILIFDYNQNLKSIMGPGTKAVESGAVTSIAVSADHSTVAGGHADGSIYTWDTARPARPFLIVSHLDASQTTHRTVDGHMPNVSVTHLGFLGTRHTALVSANDRGMAFSHLASRGTGSLGRSVKTTRILGRYPDVGDAPKPRKASTVFAFAPLPLGNVERETDTMGLTAMLTPYLLVIVSTTPIAQTQHKASRPKEVAAHGAMSGCLAWFPAVKLKVPDPTTGENVSKVKLVYCWSNVLTVMDIEEVPAEEKDKPASLFFKPRSRWKAEEPIVAVQWLSRSVLCVLTITQRLIVLEDQSMRMTEAFDLVQKHIFHQDIFSKQLHALVEQLDEEDVSMHGVVADAFYMSFKAYKGRLFLLGFNDVSIGTFSNWADRLYALMEHGDYIGAINLATTYYTGHADKLTVGLPEDPGLRHSMVRDKLVETMLASLKYALGQKQNLDQHDAMIAETQLAEACFAACLSLDDTDFLFDEVYTWYDEGDAEGIFLESLEPYILDGQIVSVPPAVMKALVSHYVTRGMESRLEEMICHVDTSTLDLDQITTLCKQHNLYDALIYVWNQALGDYITPLIDLLSLLIPLTQSDSYFSNANMMEDSIYTVNALKMFPYLSYTFTGRVYPTDEIMSEQQALNAKAEVYWFLFSGKTIAWPKGSGKPFLAQPRAKIQPTFPYLRMILKFDAPSFLSALNEAFEDSFLNDSPDRAVNGGSELTLPEEQVFGLSINRQYVVSILLEVMNPSDFTPEDTIYLDMFIARNLPKFPQYIILSGSLLHRILTGLCNYPGEDLAEDAQLSAEYLMSVYHPPDLASLIPLFHDAGFYRVLKRIYKSDKDYAKLIETYFADHDDQDTVFDVIADCLRPQKGLTKRQVAEVHDVLRNHGRGLVGLSPTRTARTIDVYAPSLHEDILNVLDEDEHSQYGYLQTILEPTDKDSDGSEESHQKEFIEAYMKLMCKFDPSHVADYVETLQTSDLRIDKVLPAMEENDVIDAVVILMAREGHIRESMARLVEHLGVLESALQGLLSPKDDEAEHSSMDAAADSLLESLQKYTNVGIWLCQGQTKMLRELGASTSPGKSQLEDELAEDELLWTDLVDATVQVTKNVSASLNTHQDIRINGAEQLHTSAAPDAAKILSSLRTLVQNTFTALLASTSSPLPSGQANLSFLRILRTFLTRASISSPNLSDLRSVLSSIFSAYTYEKSILSLANRLLEKDLFVHVQEAHALRQRGWRPRGAVCEGCKRRVWGPGAVGDVFAKWEEKQAGVAKRAKERRAALTGGLELQRGKGRARPESGIFEAPPKLHPLAPAEAAVGTEENEAGDLAGTGLGAVALKGVDLGPLLVLACRHIYHQRCLEAVQLQADTGDPDDVREFRCPIDG